MSDDSLPEWTEEELAVLRTADDDRPPSTSLAATLAAVGAGSAVATAAAAAKGAAAVASAGSSVTAAKATGALAIAKWIGVVAVGGAVVAGSVAVVQRSQDAPHESAASKRTPVVAPSQAAPSAPVTEPAAPPVAPEPVAPEPVAPEPAPADAPPSTSAPGRAPVRSQPDISLEIAAVDEARTLLRAGRPEAALAALDRYDTRFGKTGALRVEVTALRVEALLKSGKRDRATSLANTFLAHHAKSPYAARVRALIGENSP